MFFKKNKKTIIFGLILLAYTIYVLLDTFVISRPYQSIANESHSAEEENTSVEDGDLSGDENASAEDGNLSEEESSSHEDRKHSREGRGRFRNGGNRSAEEGSSSTDDENVSEEEGSSSAVKENSSAGGTVLDSYQGAGKTITLYEYRVQETDIYVADVQLKDTKDLQTAFAKDTYGKNVTAKTSEIASGKDAVLAINGDFYGARENGYVLRNGQLYRDNSMKGQEDLVIYEDGTFEVIQENEISAKALLEKGAWQILSFGPALLQNGKIAVSAGEEVGKAMASNPRTAIGVLDDLHYVFVVSDGRTKDSAGLSLSELAGFMDSLGVKTAYNLDGGGSSTMYFGGQVVNHPTTSGRSIKERSVSDIVYIR